MEIFKFILFAVAVMAILFCLKRAFNILLNIFALVSFKKDADPINQRHGMVFNKKTGQLEADQSPILPFE